MRARVAPRHCPAHCQIRLMLRSLLAVILLATALPAAEAQSDLPPAEILRRAARRDQVLRRERQRYECDVRLTVESLDRAGAVTGTRTKSYVMRPTADISLGGELLDASGKTDKDAVEARKFMAVMDLDKMGPRYELTRENNASESGRECFVIRYRPKSGQPYDSNEEKIMNQLTGRLWIARDDFSILRSEGHLERPVTVALVASVYRLDFAYRSAPLPSGEPAPESFELALAVKAPFYHTAQRQRSVLSRYRVVGR